MCGFLIPLSCCSRTEPAQQAYARAWTAFVAGDLGTAGREAASYATRERKESDSYWVWSLKLLEAEVLDAQSKWNPARDLLLAPLPADAALGQLEVRRLIDLATVQIHSGTETAKIPALLAQASAAVRDPEMRIRLEVVQGLAAMNERQWPAAQQSFAAAADRAAREGFPYWRAQALNNLSWALKKLGLYEDSIDAGQSSLAGAEKLGARRVAALAHGNLGQRVRDSGRLR